MAIEALARRPRMARARSIARLDGEAPPAPSVWLDAELERLRGVLGRPDGRHPDELDDSLGARCESMQATLLERRVRRELARPMRGRRPGCALGPPVPALAAPGARRRAGPDARRRSAPAPIRLGGAPGPADWLEDLERRRDELADAADERMAAPAAARPPRPLRRRRRGRVRRDRRDDRLPRAHAAASRRPPARAGPRGPRAARPSRAGAGPPRRPTSPDRPDAGPPTAAPAPPQRRSRPRSLILVEIADPVAAVPPTRARGSRGRRGPAPPGAPRRPPGRPRPRASGGRSCWRSGWRRCSAAGRSRCSRTRSSS